MDTTSVEYRNVARARFNNTTYASRGCSDAYLEILLNPDINLKCPFFISWARAPRLRLHPNKPYYLI
jgi:hypothetical protein